MHGTFLCAAKAQNITILLPEEGKIVTLPPMTQEQIEQRTRELRETFEVFGNLGPKTLSYKNAALARMIGLSIARTSSTDDPQADRNIWPYILMARIKHDASLVQSPPLSPDAQPYLDATQIYSVPRLELLDQVTRAAQSAPPLVPIDVSLVGEDNPITCENIVLTLRQLRQKAAVMTQFLSPQTAATYTLVQEVLQTCRTLNPEDAESFANIPAAYQSVSQQYHAAMQATGQFNDLSPEALKYLAHCAHPDMDLVQKIIEFSAQTPPPCLY
jgi:hypothetical protein